ncbi:MAG: hypothetical protein WCL50_14805, partial [Spirochaetota bacterium]
MPGGDDMANRKGGDRATIPISRKQLAVVGLFVAVSVALVLVAINLGGKARAELGTYSSSQVIVLKKSTIAGVSKEDYYEVFKIASKQDTGAMIQMMKQGRAFLIAPGSRVRVEKKHLANC